MPLTQSPTLTPTRCVGVCITLSSWAAASTRTRAPEGANPVCIPVPHPGSGQGHSTSPMTNRKEEKEPGILAHRYLSTQRAQLCLGHCCMKGVGEIKAGKELPGAQFPWFQWTHQSPCPVSRLHDCLCQQDCQGSLFPHMHRVSTCWSLQASRDPAEGTADTMAMLSNETISSLMRSWGSILWTWAWAQIRGYESLIPS